MTRPFDICIRGAGIVGHTLALHLASRQLRVALTAPGIKSPASNTHSDVRAYALNPASRALLEAVRCWPDATHATPALAMQVLGDDGGQVEFTAAALGAEALNWIVDVPTLETRLAQAVRFQPLIELFDSPQPATLNVICEGKASRTRRDWGVEWEVTPYKQWALATRIQCEKPHEQVARQWFNQSEILAFLPIGGPGSNQCAVVWSLSPERVNQLSADSEDAFNAAITVASHSQLGAVIMTSPRSSWPLQQAMAQRWCGVAQAGAWVLAGDAAHTVHPLAGQGLNLGLGDVSELAKVLADRPYWRSVSDMRLLRPYERARKAELALIGSTGDAIQQLFSQTHPAAQALRNWGMNQFERSRSIKHWVTQRAMGVIDRDSPPSPPPRKPHP